MFGTCRNMRVGADCTSKGKQVQSPRYADSTFSVRDFEGGICATRS
jgi:hypothetical protein